jgi:hypothetical protein
VQALDPDALKGFHSFGSPSVARNERPFLPMTEMGYAVNQTEAVSMAARGSGLAKGFWNMLPWPENCLRDDVGVVEHGLLLKPRDV